MSFNGSGTFVINSSGQPVVANTVISTTVFNALTADLATGLSTCITKDGQTTPTANIPMGTFKFTNLGVGSAATDSATLGQVQASTTKLVTVTGTDTITGTLTPALTAYTAGQMFYFVAGGANTGAVTLNIDGLGARNMTRHGSVALVAGDILSGEVCVVVYDGTRFQLLNPASYTNLNVTGVLALADGAVGTPSLTNTGDENTGLWFPAADTLAASVGGVEALRVLSTGNVGIGTTNPTNTAGFSRQLQIEGATAALTLSGTTGTGKYTLGVPGANAVGLWDNTASAYRWYVDSSGNLGIGTASPAFKLHVSGSSSQFALISTTDTTSTTGVLFGDSASNTVGRIEYVHSDNGMRFYTNGTTQAILDTSGNLGIGVTPSAWETANSVRALQFNGGSVFSYSNAYIFVGQNFFRNSGGVEVYVNTAAATKYEQSFGAHTWANAPSGTAGAGITFTERMRLDSSGNLGIGTTTMTGKLNVNGDIRTAGGGDLRLSNNGDPSITADDTFLYNDAKNLIVWANGSERARITSGGVFCVNSSTNVGSEVTLFKQTAGTGTPVTRTWNNETSGNNEFIEFATEASYTNRGSITYNRGGGLVAYNTTSDYRAKDILGPVQNSGATIDALKVYEGQMKGASQSRPMLVAHEAQEHAPYTVTGEKDAVNEDGTPKYQQMDVSALVPLLLAELQSLRKRVAELESK